MEYLNLVPRVSLLCLLEQRPAGCGWSRCGFGWIDGHVTSRNQSLCSND